MLNETCTACESTEGGTEAAYAEWREMDEASRSKYKGDDDGERFGRFARARILREVETRDWRWLHTGREPVPKFASEQVRRRVTKNELHTANELSKHGVSSTFIQDYQWVNNKGKKYKIGLPDLESGIEIKTITSSGNAWGALKNYFDSTKNKVGVECMVVDNTISEFIKDEELVEEARRLSPDYPEVKSVRLLLKSGEYLIIK